MYKIEEILVRDIYFFRIIDKSTCIGDASTDIALYMTSSSTKIKPLNLYRRVH